MKKTSTGLVVGLVFLVLGILYAGRALDMFDFSIFFPGFWTLFIIIPCFYGLFKKGQDKTGYIIGLVIGFCLLINAQDISLHINFWPLMLAIICIIIGVRLIFPGKYGNGVFFSTGIKNNGPGEEAKNFYSSQGGFLNISTIFGGKDVRVDNEVFRGANLNAVFGAVVLDLRNAVFEDDVTIRISTVFGGIDIYTPSYVRVVADGCNGVFGGVDISRPSVNADGPVIYITGSCVFGGVEIK